MAISATRSWMPLPVTIDGVLYVLIAMFGAALAAFGSDEAYKYIAPAVVFWLKTTCNVGLQGCLGLKLYRSTGYAHHLQDKAANEVATAVVAAGAPVVVTLPPVPVQSPT